MSIIRPYRRLQQPVGPVEIDWQHPLARGLVFYALPTQPGMPELVGRGTQTLIGSSTYSAGPSGLGVKTTSSTAGGTSFAYRQDLFRTMTTDFTVATACDITALSSNGKIICAPHYSNTWTVPYQSISLSRNSTGSQVGLFIGTVSGSNALSALFPTNTIVVGDSRRYVCTRSGTSTSLFYNGTKYAPSTNGLSSAPVVYNTGGHVALLNRSAGITGEGTAGTSYYGAFWNRALSDAEALSFQEAPYQLLRPYQRRLYIPVALPATSAENFTDNAGPKPVAWWYFNETSGNRVSSGGGNALVPSASSPTRGTGPHDYYSAEFVKANSQQFNLADANMSAGFPGKNGVANGSLTMGGWMRVDSETAGDGGIWSKDTNFQFLVEGPVIFRAFASGNGSLGYSFDDAGMSYGVWKHYVGRWTAETGAVELFVNGVKQSRVDTVATRNTWTTDMFVGNATFKSNFDGGLAELFVFDSALTDAQIADIYNYGLDARRAPSLTPQSVTGTASATKPTATATSTQTFPARSLSGAVAATKPTASSTAAQTFPARAVTATVSANKPTAAASAVQVFPARAVVGFAAAKKPDATATATQTFPARAVSGVGIVTKPTVSVTVTTSASVSSPFSNEFSYEFGGEAITSRAVSTSIVATKPMAIATATQVFPARSVTGSAIATKPGISAAATQTFPERSISATVAAKKPAAIATAAQEFPSRDLTAFATAHKPTATATVVSSRTITASASAKKPEAAATAQQTFPARSLTGSAAAKKPSAAAVAVQEFPERYVTASALAPKPSLTATAEQEFTERYVEAAVDAPKPTATAEVYQSTIGSVSVFGSAEASKPTANATATQELPERSVSTAAPAPKPTAEAVVLTTRRAAVAAHAPKPTASAAASQTFPERNVSGAASVKKPMLTASATHPYPAHVVSAAAIAPKPTASAAAIQVRGVSANAAAPKPTAVATATQVFPPRFLSASAAAGKPTVQAFVEQIFPVRSVDAIAVVTKPTAAATAIHGPSPGAAHIANTVHMSGVIDIEQRIAGSIDMDILVAGAIETDIAVTGFIEE